MNLVNVIDGICLWWSHDTLIRAVGRRIDISHDNGKSFRCLTQLDLGFTNNQKSRSPLASRLFRLNPKHCIQLTSTDFILVAANKIFLLDIKNRTSKCVSHVFGKRPLRMAFDGNALYYGEYLGNAERRPINVYRSVDFGDSWQVCHTFSGIRHVHGVYHDPITDCVWITTGDFNSEAAIWKTDSNFAVVTPILSGSQQTRVIDLLFNNSGITFGTDAPEDQNRIYSMTREGTELVELAKVEGPVFHAFNSSNDQFFSTACEPSASQNFSHAVINRCRSGEVTEVARFKKDRWSMKYFQYGQMLFPSGQGAEHNLWCSSFACEQDQRSFHFQG